MADHDNWDEHWNRYAEAANRNPAQQMRHWLMVGLLGAGDAEADLKCWILVLDRAISVRF